MADGGLIGFGSTSFVSLWSKSTSVVITSNN